MGDKLAAARELERARQVLRLLQYAGKATDDDVDRVRVADKRWTKVRQQ